MALSRGASLVIAGFGLGFESDQPGIISVLRRRYAPFLSRRHVGLRLAVSEGPRRAAPFRPELSLDRGRLRIARGDFQAEVRPGAGTGELTAAPNEQCLDAFLRSLLSALLLRSGGLMLHSAGIVHEGRAWLFPGVSGAGKSTLAKLAAGAGTEVISDEMNMLRFEKGRPFLYGSPFWGEMRADGRPGRWALAGIRLPRKSSAHFAQDCGPGEALRVLLRCAVNFSRSGRDAGAALAVVSRLMAAAPPLKLHFSRSDAGFLGFLR